MVSKASEDLPDPERPVKTTSLSRGMERVTFLRLCSRAPRMVIWSVGIRTFGYPLFSRDRKRPAGGGDQPPLEGLDPALADRGPPPGMHDAPGRSQGLAHPGRRDEAQLEVEAHRTRHAGYQGAQRAAHRGVGQRTD